MRNHITKTWTNEISTQCLERVEYNILKGIIKTHNRNIYKKKTEYNGYNDKEKIKR